MTYDLTNRATALPLDGVRTATTTARWVVLAAFVATALLVSALALERLAFQRSSGAAIDDVKSALSIAGVILLEDERLTMSANLSATSGELRWARRYEEHLPLIDKAIAAATALAPPDAARRFDLGVWAADALTPG